MLITHNNKLIELLGDPHLGRRFLNGVPLDKRGIREKMVWDEFNDSIQKTKADIHICMGDVFDKPIVPYSLILKTANAYKVAAANHVATTYVVLRGNHDADRDLERSSAFDVFAALMNGVEGVRIVHSFPDVFEGLAFFPWHPVYRAKDLVLECSNEECWPDDDFPKLAFGHWDVEDFGTSNPNMLPAAALKAAGVETAYTGHDHKARDMKIEGLPVVVVGSMQPYAHGEEPNDDFYITATLDEVVADVDKYKNRCLRVLLTPGEIFDVDVDYLQLTIKRLDADGEEEDELEVGDGGFDIEALITKAFTEEELTDEDILDQINQKILEKRAIE